MIAAPLRTCDLCGGSARRLRYEIDGYHLVTCTECGLTFVAEAVPQEELDRYYSEGYYTGAQAKGYADYIGRREHRKAHFRSLLPEIRRHLGRDGHPRVLDVGCAAGFFLEVARDEGWEAVGVELSSFAADYARTELGLNVITGTLAQADLAPESFDLVTMWDVIEHLREPRATLLRAHSLMRPGGLMAISTGDLGGFTARIFRRRWALLAPPGHLFYFSRRTLYAMLRRTGFEPLGWSSDGAFLLNDACSPGGSAENSFVVRAQSGRWMNRILRKLKLGSIMTVYARRCPAR